MKTGFRTFNSKIPFPCHRNKAPEKHTFDYCCLTLAPFFTCVLKRKHASIRCKWWMMVLISIPPTTNQNLYLKERVWEKTHFNSICLPLLHQPPYLYILHGLCKDILMDVCRISYPWGGGKQPDFNHIYIVCKNKTKTPCFAFLWKACT